MRGSTLLAQARATRLTSVTTLTVPFPTQATALTPNLPGLSAGPVQAQVWQQTGTSSFSPFGSAISPLAGRDPIRKRSPTRDPLIARRSRLERDRVSTQSISVLPPEKTIAAMRPEACQKTF
jgi:hypothetical protein